jgi:hypothetical protein
LLDEEAGPSNKQLRKSKHLLERQERHERLDARVTEADSITNLFNSVLQRKCTGVQPHYFDVWELEHQVNPDVVHTLVTINFYSDVIFVIFIHNSIFCRTAIQRSLRRSTGQMYKTRGQSPSTSPLRMLRAEVPHMEVK